MGRPWQRLASPCPRLGPLGSPRVPGPGVWAASGGDLGSAWPQTRVPGRPKSGARPLPADSSQEALGPGGPSEGGARALGSYAVGIDSHHPRVDS